MKSLACIGLYFYISTQYLQAQTVNQLSYGILDGPGHLIHKLHADTANDLLYVGGAFEIAGNKQCHNIAVWNDIEWDSIRNNLLSDVRSLQIYREQLFVGDQIGFEDSVGNLVVPYFAILDTVNNTFSILDSGANSFVAAYHVYNSELFIGGAFSKIGGVSTHKIAKYDGSNWSSFPTLSSDPNWIITCLAHYQNDLYVGGNFVSDQAPYIEDIARWDGASWHQLGIGLSGFLTWINDMVIYNGNLIVAGNMNVVNGDPGNGIAAWDGQTWSQLGTGVLPGQVHAVEVYNNNLYVAGAFNIAGGLTVSFIARYDGAQWHNLNVNFDNVIFDLAVLNNNLYIAGGFNVVGNDSINFIVKYSDGTGLSASSSTSGGLRIYPNPTSGLINIEFEYPIFKSAKMYLYNALGELVLIDDFGSVSHLDIDLSQRKSGIYCLVIVIDNHVYSKAIIKN